MKPGVLFSSNPHAGTRKAGTAGAMRFHTLEAWRSYVRRGLQSSVLTTASRAARERSVVAIVAQAYARPLHPVGTRAATSDQCISPFTARAPPIVIVAEEAPELAPSSQQVANAAAQIQLIDRPAALWKPLLQMSPRKHGYGRA